MYITIERKEKEMDTIRCLFRRNGTETIPKLDINLLGFSG